MAERSLAQILAHLKIEPDLAHRDATAALSRAKLLLLQLSALVPTDTTPPPLLLLARETYELGALACIRELGRHPLAPLAAGPADAGPAATRHAFVRYVQQLQPFYDLPPSELPPGAGDTRSKVTGLYLLLLLTDGRYADFHSELERLAAGREDGWEIEADRFLAYPVRLERWLMEGSYDRVWRAMQSREVPCEEYNVFSDILTRQIRSEIASSSERAYPSLPLSSTKALLFLDSEGAVIAFARHRGWIIRDGEIFFPDASAAAAVTSATGYDAHLDADSQRDHKLMSRAVIESALGYARELETIV